MKYLLIIVLFITFAFRSSGQLSYGGTPLSFSQKKELTSLVPFIEMDPVSNTQLLKEESLTLNRLKPFRFAKSFNVDISPNSAGVWTVGMI